MSRPLFQKPTRRKRPIMGDEDVALYRSVSPAAAAEYINSQGDAPRDVDLSACICGKCQQSIDVIDECRFYAVRGGYYNGLRMAAHARCLSCDDAVSVSLPAAFAIFQRQSAPVKKQSRRGNGRHAA